MSNAGSEDPRWREYRRRRNALLGAALCLLALLLLATAFPEAPVLGQYWWILAPVLLLWFIVADIRIAFWPCPSCGLRFFTRGIWFGRVFARRCLHCGLPVWNVPSDARGA